MATQFANGKTTTSGLVFMYDTTDKENCYKGEPTTNLAGPDFTTWSVDTSGFSATGTRTILSTYHCRIEDSNTNTRHYKWIYGLSANTNYTFSVKFKKISGAPTLRFQISTFNGGTYINNNFPTTVQIGIADVDGWQTAIYSITTPAGTDRVVWFIQDGDDYTGYTHSFELKDVQLEQKSHVTPFTSSTRSGTEGLKDLMVTSQIDISNVSFDANAQMTFDGSDDHALTSNNVTVNGSQTLTAIAIISGGPQSPAGIISNHDYANNSNFGLNHINGNRIGISIGYTDNTREYDSKYTTYTATVGVPFYIAMTFDQLTNTVKLYVNGILDSTFVLSKTVKFTSRPIVLGRWDYQYNYYYFNGKIPTAQYYNRALTNEEVLQNYNAIKTRFNLA